VSQLPDSGKLAFEYVGKTVKIPKSAVIAWQAGLVDYLVGLLQAEGTKDFAFPDMETTTLLKVRLDATPVLKAIGSPQKDPASEGGRIVARQMTTVLNPDADDAMKAQYLRDKDGYGVAAGAAPMGSFAIGEEGNQGYYVDKTKITDESGRYLSGHDVFMQGVGKAADFFARKSEIKPVMCVIKTGIGGQHTPFQAIAQVVNNQTGLVIGEYELGKDYENSLEKI
jgi:hypothetical protein